jgi:hypothetical protein
VPAWRASAARGRFVVGVGGGGRFPRACAREVWRARGTRLRSLRLLARARWARAATLACLPRVVEARQGLCPCARGSEG